MESHFGHDFGAVRVHTDEAAAASAHALDARAFTVGNDVTFGPGEFDPATQRGRELLAHELAHTIQQTPACNERPSNDPRGSHEASAQTAAQDVASGRDVTDPLPVAGVGVSLQPNTEDDAERAKAVAEAEAMLAQMNAEEAEEEEASAGVATPAPRETGPPVLHDYGAAAMLAELDASKKRESEAEQAARHDEDVARHDRLMILRGLVGRRMDAGHPYRKNELVAMMSSHPRDLLVLRHFGLDLPGFWTKQKTYNRHVKAVLDAYDYDWRKRYGSGDAPSAKPWTESNQAAVDKRRKEDENDAAAFQGYSYATQSLLAGAGAEATRAFTDDPKKIAAGAGLGMGFSGAAAPFAQAKGQQRTYKPQVQNVPVSPVGAWRYTGQPKIVVSGNAPPNATGNSGLSFPRPVDVTGSARFPARDQPRVSMKLPEPKPVVKSEGAPANASADKASDGPMRRARAGEDRPGMTATQGTLKPHKKQNPVVETLPRSTVPMTEFEPPEPGHYIRRKPPSAETQRQILARAGRTQDGRLRDANTGRALNEGEAVWGHSPHYQFAEMRDMAERLRWTQAQFDQFFEDPGKWQVEYGPTNSSRVYDRIPRQRPVH